MLLGKIRQRHGSKTAGGLLVLLWTEAEASVQSLNCTGKPEHVSQSEVLHQKCLKGSRLINLSFYMLCKQCELSFQSCLNCKHIYITTNIDISSW